MLPGRVDRGYALRRDGAASARIASGTMRSAAQSPPPITFPARAVAMADEVSDVACAHQSLHANYRLLVQLQLCWRCKGHGRQADRFRGSRSSTHG